jgi:superfamily II DNA or RNA helicase
MAWTSQLSRQVAADVRRRGAHYYMTGAVRILKGDAEKVEASVRGTQVYAVTLDRRGKVIKAHCSCPYFQDRERLCKHVWATLLVADEKGYLRGPDDSAPRRLKLAADGDGAPAAGRQGNQGRGDGRHQPAGRNGASAQARPGPGGKRGRRKRKRSPDWKKTITNLRGNMERADQPRGEGWPAGREVLYVVDAQASGTAGALVVEVAVRERKKNGEWTKPKAQRLALEQITRLPDPADREALSLLVGAKEQTDYGFGGWGYNGWYESAPRRYQLTAPQQGHLLPLMCRTGHAYLRKTAEDVPQPLRWDEGGPWELWLVVVADKGGKRYLISGELRRGEERRPLARAALLLRGLVLWEDHAAALEDFGAFDWVGLLRQTDALPVPATRKEDLIQELLRVPHLPRLDLPEELQFEEVKVPARPRLKIHPPRTHAWGPPRLRGELSFEYDSELVPANQPGRGLYQGAQRRMLLRDPEAERAAEGLLRQLGFRSPAYHPNELELAPRNLQTVVRALLSEGWQVEAEGKLYRRPGRIDIQVSSGIDWFELDGTVDFGGTVAHLPALLAALRRGDNAVPLGDGTYGILPEEWLKKYGLVAGLGKVEGDRLRFTRSQVGLLDALVASQPEAACDEVFARARDELRRFEGVKAAAPPAGFSGVLRGYQREGLGWLYFLQQFGFGGCLADDMGLGKTVQVLALLESRRELREQGGADAPGPSLVVVPKSLVFNWKQEAARFAPKLRVLDHTGAGRAKPGEHFDEYDLILTTYGTLRRDALEFKDQVFDYCVLDEAQAIKNASSESAKAARLLRARHRLALSGTPVENHLGELWSLFEFLNPGMLGSASVFQLTGAGARNPSEETRTLLAKALRPFILRRTKGQVAKDLPAKVEQTIYCDLEPAQRKLYDELRHHYRDTLLARVEREGLNRSKIQVLEALLRLRQAACHPGLIDKERTGDTSAKLDVLLPSLLEVTEEGHKCLVFSQFTSFLAIVRERLDQEQVPYLYLDGRTRDRAARVEQFQTDPERKLFLISLKAGGLGLNLTAAEYVFLLDPWWNPAVEAQAIDRAHRIGQTEQVFACRLIARDTVEEKVLALQESKRELADAIINADNSLIRGLGRDDLELLLS